MIKFLVKSKCMVLFVVSLTIFVSMIGFSKQKVSAELYRGTFGIDYPFEHECTLIIDKANNIVKTNKFQKSTGVCKEDMKGYYFKNKDYEFATTMGWESDDIDYNGEPYYNDLIFHGDKKAREAQKIILYAFVTNTNENIKGKTMHVAAANLKVYKSANSKSKSITSVKRYKTVKVSSVKGTWAKVKVNGKTGWVTRKYLVNDVTVAEVEKVILKYKTYTRLDPTLETGKKVLAQKGENGYKYVYYHTKYKNGKLISKKKRIWTEIKELPQDKYYRLGE